MADPIQLDLLRRSVTEWNAWREHHSETAINLSKADLSGIDLREANLSGANLREAKLIWTKLHKANLSEANLSKADLIAANLREANLTWAKLRKASLIHIDLSKADLSSADLQEANLTWAKLRKANLSEANLSNVNLSEADLSSTNLSGTNLSNVNLSEATIGNTSFGDRDFREIRGLNTIDHRGPSPLSINSIYLSEGKIPEAFVRGTGAPDTFLEYMHALTARPIEYYTCFISYSSKDQSFAERLYADLQHNGVRCWFAPHNMRPGTVIVRGIDEAIRLYDKLLLVLSQHSVESTWVEFEVAAALEKEKDQQKDTLFPIRLDDTILTTKQAWAAGIRRQRHIGDFTQWKNHDTYQLTFDRLLRDLKQGKA